MKTLRAKLKSRAGESLAEVLIALLVSALALLMLASMISASFKVITTSRDKLKTYYEFAALAKPGGEEAEVTVSAEGAAMESYLVAYSIYSDLGHEDIVSYVPTA